MKTIVRNTYGSIALSMFSNQAQSLETGAVQPESKFQRLLFDAITRKAAKNKDEQLLKSQLARYWQNQTGEEFYETYADFSQQRFLSEHYSLVTALKSFLSAHPAGFNRLVEIGCGNGQILHHLHGAFPALHQFTGIDINETIIKRNQEFYSEDTLQFVAADVMDWFRQPRGSGIVLFSCGGVMEYLLESELLELFATLKKRSAPSVVALAEPLYDDFDSEKELHSRSGGKEHSFSHNYSHLLKESGFNILFDQELPGEWRWKLVLASTEKAP
jgi:predicted TPR repeat methyltransferase